MSKIGMDDDEGIFCLFAPLLEANRTPMLQEIALYNMRIGHQLPRLCRAIENGAKPKLEKLSIHTCYLGDDGVSQLISSFLKVGSSLSLRELEIVDNELSNEANSIMADAFSKGACPQLVEFKRLRMDDEPNILIFMVGSENQKDNEISKAFRASGRKARVKACHMDIGMVVWTL